ncbi:MAG: hypothetical protein KKE94_10135 [Gammaproteobacteria bacterium]|nr:hypothetical protein [Gammaproteobacteria bacterium]
MQREKLAMLCSGILFGLAIVAFPDQFLFSKTVPNSFWTEYFPLPFGAGWFITFIVLVPAVWMNKSVFSAMKAAILSVLPAMLMAVPISLSIIGDSLLPNNLLNQYLWVAIIALLPLLLHIVLRWCSCLYADKWLTKSL